MYEGQLICKDLIEENWLEYLAYVKKGVDMAWVNGKETYRYQDGGSAIIL